MAYARNAPICDVVAAVRGADYAVAYRAYAIRPYERRKTQTNHSFPNTPKTTTDLGKTMSDVGKNISDIIQTTSDLFSAFARL